MDHLKNQVYNAIKRFVFNYNEWMHANDILSQSYKSTNAKEMTYAAISFSAKPTKNRWGDDDAYFANNKQCHCYGEYY